ncbi:MAG: site-specific DNA-methyltransferase, partial [Candidatus Heimdallarchaeota archaeon]|nr:site-specific DNA-methyltransferase [Candidatus Heimdallarchaeota archaeon]
MISKLDDLSILDKNNLSLNFVKLVDKLFYFQGKISIEILFDIINQINLQQGDHTYDPFCGSGTTGISSNLLNISHTGIDISNFSVFLSNVKGRLLHSNMDIIFELKNLIKTYDKLIIPNFPLSSYDEIGKFINNEFIKSVFALILLDTQGFMQRNLRYNFNQALKYVSNRYFNNLSNYYRIRDNLKLSIGKSEYSQNDARLFKPNNK